MAAPVIIDSFLKNFIRNFVLPRCIFPDMPKIRDWNSSHGAQCSHHHGEDHDRGSHSCGEDKHGCAGNH